MILDNFPDDYFMNEALKEARKSMARGEVPVGAVIACQNKIIARGHNQTEQLTDATAHAEMIAITGAENFLGTKYLNECTLYVTLEPCIMCAGALSWVQLQRLVFGAHDVQRGYSLVKSPVLHPKTQVEHGVRKDECAALVLEFFRQLRQ